MARSLNEWLWQHEYWLPPGITWEDMKESEDIHYPQPHDLLLSIPFALILVAIRCFFERTIALPLSGKLGVRDKLRPKAQSNPMLETFYSMRCKNPKEGELISLAKQCDLPVRKVERWFRRRRNIDRPSLSKKFCEACWRFTFYIISFFTGLAVLYDVSIQVPLQPSLFWYYLLELSFYCSLVFTLPFDVKRKDFKEQIVHHAATIFLISFSYCANYIRIGTLVMVIHDASDCFLEMEKDMRSDTEESDKDEEREKIREKEKNGITHFSNITSNNCIQRNGSQQQNNRTHLTNGHAKER
uniref:Homeobox domain-containing protein n=1 Tax=Apteryx owenii TaxID=8824 RepID=A0A8B9SCT5_APTOW